MEEEKEEARSEGVVGQCQALRDRAVSVACVINSFLVYSLVGPELTIKQKIQFGRKLKPIVYLIGLLNQYYVPAGKNNISAFMKLDWTKKTKSPKIITLLQNQIQVGSWPKLTWDTTHPGQPGAIFGCVDDRP